MKTYELTIPIAGHAFVTVIAESREDAIEKAMVEITREHIEEWEPLEQFHQGNVCFCPRPWEVDVVEGGEIEEE